MSNLNPEELGRIVANAVSGYLQPSGSSSQRNDRNEGRENATGQRASQVS